MFDPTTGLTKSRSTVFSAAKEAVVVAFRCLKLLPLNDCLYASQPLIPYLTWPALHQRLQRHGRSRLPDVEGDKQGRQRFKLYHDDTREHPQTHLAQVLAADNLAHLLKTFSRLKLYEYICKIWRSGTQPFTPHPMHLTPGLTTSRATRGIKPSRAVGIRRIAAKPPVLLRRRRDQPEQVKAN